MTDVKITREKLETLERAAKKLEALERGGVDKWEWYEESLRDYHNSIQMDERAVRLIHSMIEIVADYVAPADAVGTYYVRDEAVYALLPVVRPFLGENQ